MHVESVVWRVRHPGLSRHSTFSSALNSMRILITGASGSGTSTLAAALAGRLGARFLDSDDYFWLPGDPPFTRRRPPDERLARILADLATDGHAVVSGAVDGWGRILEDSFDLVIFLWVPTPVRMARLERREIQRFGRVNAEFLAWAAQYDAGTAEGRSLERQTAWLDARHCAVLRLHGELTQTAQFAAIAPVLSGLPGEASALGDGTDWHRLCGPA